MTAEPLLLLGDCMELLKEIPDGSVDMVLTDPPYSSGGLFAGDRKASTREKYTNDDFNGAARFPDFSGDNMDQRSFTEFMRMILIKARRKSRTEAVCAVFVDWRNLPALTDAMQSAGWIWRGVCVWDKGNSRNIPGRYRQECEFIVWGTNGPKSVDWTPGLPAIPGVYHVKSVPTREKHHQTEKPVELLEGLLAICPEGGTVLDAFMGSGSTGVACVNTGRRFVGMELSPVYFETARRRVREARERVDLEARQGRMEGFE